MSRFNRDQWDWIALPGAVSVTMFVLVILYGLGSGHSVVSSVEAALIMAIVVMGILTGIDVLTTWIVMGRFPRYFGGDD